ncbi:MAG: hypothetical protein JHC95_17380 [Solirubrobacteraceae bacterium]|nr:hypothetical protein [Solirubrobacteraceae bacterium]
MDREPLEGIAAADAHLRRAVPLPTVVLPLPRWVDVFALGPDAVEVAWNLDDTRSGPGRLALYAGHAPAPPRAFDPPAEPVALGRYAHRTMPLADADPSLKPVHELSWADDGLHLRLTGQGPWGLEDLVAVADSVRAEHA